jgi:hypothetical protein
VYYRRTSHSICLILIVAINNNNHWSLCDQVLVQGDTHILRLTATCRAKAWRAILQPAHRKRNR